MLPQFARRCFRVAQLDHVCVAVSCVDTSIGWYEGVLGLSLSHADHPCFGKDPAFLSNGDAKVALLPLADGQPAIKNHNGAHFAFNVCRADFDEVRTELPGRLLKHKAHEQHRTDIEEQDYGLQLSLFFHDPDDNIVEITSWVSEDDPARL